MHRIDRPVPPGTFVDYCRRNAESRDWEAFRSTTAYAESRDILAGSQFRLCAYCEQQLSVRQMRIEHFHPKSDKDAAHNWTLDWGNLLCVCMGGEVAGRKCDDDQLHCDAHKKDGVDEILNPYEMDSFCHFTLDSQGDFHAVALRDQELVEKVERTIRVLNLNCDELSGLRRLVRSEFERKRKVLRNNPAVRKSIRATIAQEWFGNARHMSFYTARRILLGKYAEAVIAQGSEER